MKRKFFYFAASALALTACTSEEVLDESRSVQSNAIGFENVVSKQSRAGEENYEPLDGVSITKDNLDRFCVFGYYTKEKDVATAIQVFDNVYVTKKEDGTWGYDNIRYWVPGAEYQFYAYSCGDLKLGTDLGTFKVDFEKDTDGERIFRIDEYRCDRAHQHDLLFAKSKKIKGKEKGDNNQLVAFKFNHLLSMIDAQFTSMLPEDYTIKISKVSVEGIINKGDYDSNTSAWSDLKAIDTNGKISGVDLRTVTTMDGETSNFITAVRGENEVKPKTQLAFVLPFDYKVNDKNGNSHEAKLSFVIEVQKGDETVLNRKVSGSWKPVWELGHRYTYNIIITGDVANLDAIEFGVESVIDWDGTTSAPTNIVFKSDDISTENTGN